MNQCHMDCLFWKNIGTHSTVGHNVFPSNLIFECLTDSYLKENRYFMFQL